MKIVKTFNSFVNEDTRRYSDQLTMESKFNDAVKDLIDTGDIERSEYIQFCIENNVEPIIQPKPKQRKSSASAPGFPSNYQSSGCGGGFTRSAC